MLQSRVISDPSFTFYSVLSNVQGLLQTAHLWANTGVVQRVGLTSAGWWDVVLPLAQKVPTAVSVSSERHWQSVLKELPKFRSEVAAAGFKPMTTRSPVQRSNPLGHRTPWYPNPIQTLKTNHQSLSCKSTTNVQLDQALATLIKSNILMLLTFIITVLLHQL